ncbi:hypothetical protein SPSIL_057590 [Sporomusa silvacetica DSM 10669]|uniref:Recombination endonuclease VII n=1 Tax=Sporomusa silvacetica DSM 10669 TaxID=1123289 RepID=A0ABZ3IVD4_9FIRM|nr:hypothetical protein [Sporomusa silvacetica]OZC14293.1 hypothetical protein SPSIL_50200 [Sporomusa silvacetica DSM 10669]
MQTKICRKCGNELPLDNFYKHSEMLDGHLNHCKDCVKSRVAKHRSEHAEEIREYDRERGKTEKRQQLRTVITRRRRHEVSGYQKSHNAIVREIANGKLQRSNTCQICGNQCKTEAHHYNYDLTKSVVWLCPVCHRNYHQGKSEKANQIRKIVDLMLSLKTTG